MPDKPNNAFEVVRHWDDLPDSAVTPTKVTALVLGVSERTVRYHPKLRRRQISRGRYGQSVGDVRRLMRGEETFEPIGNATARIVSKLKGDR